MLKKKKSRNHNHNLKLLMQIKMREEKTKADKSSTKSPVVPHADGGEKVVGKKASDAATAGKARDAAKPNIPAPVKPQADDASGTTNGGYNSATWGTLDTSKWTGQNATFDGKNYYQLTGYNGDKDHIIVPNEDDFKATGQSTNNLQVAISNDLLKSWSNATDPTKNATTIAFSKTGDKKVKLVSDNLDSAFENNRNLTNLDANSLDTSSVTSMKKTFHAATKLSSLTGISDWDTSNVTSMVNTFRGMNSLHTLAGLENWDVRKVTDMNNIFNEENTGNNVDISALSNWQTSSLQNLSTAFANIQFTNLHGLENWDVSHVTNMSSIFMNDDQLTDISALANWDTSNVTDMNRAFNVNRSLTNLHGLEKWDTSKVTNFEAMFANESALVDASGIANWNTSNVTNMNALFTNSNPQYIDFSKWNFSKVTDASNVLGDNDSNIKTVVYFGNNSTITANKLNTLGFAQVDQPIILASGALYQLLHDNNDKQHVIHINNADGTSKGTIDVPVVYDAGTASDATAAIKSYKAMVDQKVQQYANDNNCALKLISTDPVNDLTGHNNHLVNYAQATYATTEITIQFIDDNDNGSQVDSDRGGTLTLDKNNQVKFTIPANYQLAQNQTGVTITSTGDQATLTHEPTGGQVTVQIHLVHQIDDVQETDTRTATVQYIYANGDKAGQKAAADAVLKVAYKRTNKKDKVANKIVKYGNWLWDQSKNDDGFTNGYKVISGDWTLPQNWANVSVKPPDVAGYQAITTGDWEINQDGSQSIVPANQFVFPAYAGHGISTEGDNSVAYTDDAPVYESLPVHTVYYAEIKDEGRLVTKSFKKYENGTYTDADVVTLPDGTKRSYAQIKVWYQSTPAEVKTNKSSDPKEWQVTYNDWTWNKDGGDQSTPGFTVIRSLGRY